MLIVITFGWNGGRHLAMPKVGLVGQSDILKKMAADGTL